MPFLLLSLFLATGARAATLPLVEVPVTAGRSDTLVVFVSGDGGWARIDQSISRVLASKGMPVVGLNSLQYFWTKRSPETASRDLQSIIETHLATSGKSRVVLVGYSRGADVLPAMASRLPADVRSRIRLIALLAPGTTVEFEFHVADWLHDRRGGMQIRPEVAKLAPQHILCVWGEDDDDSLCRGLSGPGVEVVTLRGSHHFDGGYEKLAGIILGALQ
ncbi:MAG: virulence factor family protein [Thermoanaerobaculia bacterium]